MVNRIEGGFFPYRENGKVERTHKRNARNNTATSEGVKISINPEVVESVDELLAERKINELKELIKEGKYPLDREKLAEKIVNFLLDGG